MLGEGFSCLDFTVAEDIEEEGIEFNIRIGDSDGY